MRYQPEVWTGHQCWPLPHCRTMTGAWLLSRVAAALLHALTPCGEFPIWWAVRDRWAPIASGFGGDS